MCRGLRSQRLWPLGITRAVLDVAKAGGGGVEGGARRVWAVPLGTLGVFLCVPVIWAPPYVAVQTIQRCGVRSPNAAVKSVGSGVSLLDPQLAPPVLRCRTP